MSSSMKKRILFIAPSPLYLEKGSSLRMYAIAENLSKRYSLDILTYSLGKDFSLSNTKVYRTPKWFKPKLEVGKPTFSKIFLDLFIFCKAFSLSIKNKYDIIHCEDFEGAFIGYLISFFNTDTKLVYDLHNRVTDNLRLNSKKNSLKKISIFLEKKIVSKFDLIILNWNKYYNENIFWNKKRFLYYDKINTNVEKYPLPKEEYIIYTGNFEPYQGIKSFLNTFKEVKSNVKLVLVGPQNEDIKNFVDNNGLNNRIIFTGRLSVPKTNYLIENSLFGIVPRIAGSSMKVIHYLIRNKPVLATNTNSNQELIKDENNGWLYSNNSQLKLLLIKILSNENEIKKLIGGVKETKKKILNIWKVNNFLREYEN